MSTPSFQTMAHNYSDPKEMRVPPESGTWVRSRAGKFQGLLASENVEAIRDYWAYDTGAQGQKNPDGCNMLKHWIQNHRLIMTSALWENQYSLFLIDFLFFVFLKMFLAFDSSLVLNTHQLWKLATKEKAFTLLFLNEIRLRVIRHSQFVKLTAP